MSRFGRRSWLFIVPVSDRYHDRVQFIFRIMLLHLYPVYIIVSWNFLILVLAYRSSGSVIHLS